MAEDARLTELTGVAADLRKAGLRPVLVGGMALVVMGSQRVTKDVDFVIAHPRDHLGQLVDLFYDRGFELVSRINDAGEATSTIDNPKVACARLRLDKPVSLFFFNHAIDLRIDLLLDFPVSAAELDENATTMTIRSRSVAVASPKDLLRLKEIAQAERSFAGDAQDVEFLKRHLKIDDRKH